MESNSELSHLDTKGRSSMVDVGDKNVTRREAEAEVRVVFPKEIFGQILAGELPKGGLVEPARIAGIQATKRTSELIPLCHPLNLDIAEIVVEKAPGGAPELLVRCICCTSGRTGVEMEAMTGAAVAALTLYDMTKALYKGIRIEGLRLLRKSGGKSGEWTAQ
ncbi:MAG: cyclic pyranopterin monophosphate synthase MoaC [Planctomycetes bacterium]|nr:cyclic pyranopterin monophosphate synthase MoaC [Planctomycetota bacterium]